MSSERDEARDRQTGEYDRQPVTDAPHVHTFNVTPKARTRETIAVLVTLAALFLLLILFLGHPGAPRPLLHPHDTASHGASTAH